MKNETHERKKRVAYEILIVLGIFALIFLVIGLWPIALLLTPVIIICALRFLFLKSRTVEVIVPAQPAEPPAPPENEHSIIQKAFGLVQRRITEQLALQFPGARWVWGVPNAIDRFKNNEPLIAFLNSAGGYNKANVVVHDMLFKGLYYITLETANPPAVITVDTPAAEPADDPEDLDDNDDHEISEYTYDDDEPVNYGRLAFEWVDSNMGDINAKYNESIAQNEKEMLIPADVLPHPDSWPDICTELKRNGFSLADFCEDGIKVNITQ